MPATHEPVTDEPATPRRRAWRRPGAGVMALGVLALLLVLVWALGGFRGGATVVDAEPGQTMALGPLDFTPEREAVASKMSFGDDWYVDVRGTCTATLEDGGLRTSLLESPSVFAMADDVPREHRLHNVDHTTSVLLDPDNELGAAARNVLAPGTSMGCRFRAEMPAAFDPSHGVLVAISRMDFRDTSVTGDQTPVWSASDSYYRLRLPVVEVASAP